MNKLLNEATRRNHGDLSFASRSILNSPGGISTSRNKKTAVSPINRKYDDSIDSPTNIQI